MGYSIFDSISSSNVAVNKIINWKILYLGLLIHYGVNNAFCRTKMRGWESWILQRKFRIKIYVMWLILNYGE